MNIQWTNVIYLGSPMIRECPNKNKKAKVNINFSFLNQKSESFQKAINEKDENVKAGPKTNIK